MSKTSFEQGEQADLVRNYRPLGIKALRAATAVKSQLQQKERAAHYPLHETLPEGFHWPHDLQIE